MTYPNGREDATESYDEAINPSEKSIYTGTTNNKGEVLLCEWANEGQLRIVQHVPDGYTTNEREVRVDLANSTSANFVDYRGGNNPVTGRSMLFIVIIASVVALTLVARRNKKALLVIPVAAIAFLVNKTNAEESCFAVQIKDGAGSALKNVTVDVYAAPVFVDDSPAVKFVSNGGYFFDGSTEAYMRLPSESCTVDEFFNSLSDYDRNFFEDNLNHAYRKGYYPDGFNYPDTLVNGTEVSMGWYRDSNANIIELNGNGGLYDFYGKQLTSVYFYQMQDVNLHGPRFYKGDDYYTGVDETAACSRFNDNGVYNEIQEEWIEGLDEGALGPGAYRREDPELKEEGSQDATKYTYYVCWHNKPDGIYVNGNLYPGKPDTCFFESKASFESISLGTEFQFTDNKEETSVYIVYDDETETLRFSPIIPKVSREAVDIPSETLNLPNQPVMNSGSKNKPTLMPLTKVDNVEIVRNGVTILTLSASDFEEIGEHQELSVTNQNKTQALINYFEDIDEEKCSFLFPKSTTLTPEAGK